MTTQDPKVNLKQLALSRKDLLLIDPTIIVMKDGWNVRVEGPDLEAHISTLATSMGNIGFLADKPLTVYLDDGRPVLTDGHCRLRAVLKAREAGAEIVAVPVVVEPRGSNEADRVAGILTRNAGKPLTVLEAGAVYKRLIAFGWSEQRIADVTGKSLIAVREALTVQAAPVELHAAIAAGEVTATGVLSALRAAKGDGEKATQAVKTEIAKAAATGAKGKVAANAVGKATAQAANGVTLRLRGAEIAALRGILEGVLAHAESGVVNDDTLTLIHKLLPALPVSDF